MEELKYILETENTESRQKVIEENIWVIEKKGSKGIRIVVDKGKIVEEYKKTKKQDQKQ